MNLVTELILEQRDQIYLANHAYDEKTWQFKKTRANVMTHITSRME